MNPSNAGTAEARRESGTRVRSLTVALVGSGGDGVALLGDLLLRMAARQGLYGMMVQSYGPQIRGGESASMLRFADSEIQYEGEDTDVLVCFRTTDLPRFRGSIRLHPSSLVILDEADTGGFPDWAGLSLRTPYRFPFATFQDGTEVPGEPRNMLALGLLVRVLGWAAEPAREALRERFGHRPTALAANLAALERGLAAKGVPEAAAPAGRGSGLIVESGNEACARGAIEAGVRFFAGYPITPSSEIMETMLEELPARSGRVVQAEDEMAALGMVIGASFGGVPSMTATSGPGLSLMTEMLGLASMAELPAVVVDAQRAGPATGMPSRTEQSDLFHAVFGGHGDFPRVVMAAFDVVHARELMHRAVSISERYQLPVIVLTDAYIAQRRQIRDAVSAAPPPPHRRAWTEAEGGIRFAISADGVMPFRVPGTPGGEYLAAGIEHTAQGSPTSDGAVHQQMNAKRFRKMTAIAAETAGAWRALGDPAARRGVVAWGSTYGLLREWVRDHPGFRAFLPEVLHPFPVEAFETWRQGIEDGAVVEMSYQGQLHQLMASRTELGGFRRVARSGGLPFSARELTRLLEETPC